MSTVSKGEYGVPAGLVFGYPCTTSNGGPWKIVEGVKLDAFGQITVDSGATLKYLEYLPAALNLVTDLPCRSHMKSSDQPQLAPSRPTGWSVLRKVPCATWQAVLPAGEAAKSTRGTPFRPNRL